MPSSAAAASDASAEAGYVLHSWRLSYPDPVIVAKRQAIGTLPMFTVREKRGKRATQGRCVASPSLYC